MFVATRLSAFNYEKDRKTKSPYTVMSSDDKYEISSDDASMSVLEENENFDIDILAITNAHNDVDGAPSISLGKSLAGNNMVTDDSSFDSSTETKQLQPEYYLLPPPIMERLESFFDCGEGSYYDKDARGVLTLDNVVSDYSFNHYDYSNDNDNETSCSSINIASFVRNRNPQDYYSDKNNHTANATVLSIENDNKISLDASLMTTMEEYKDKSAYGRGITATRNHDDDDRPPLKILGLSTGKNSPISFPAEEKNLQQQYYVLSPPTMESLRQFFPYSKKSENFWLRYSLVRDGASMHAFLENARGARHSIIAVETVDGEVFGSFTSEPWRKTWNSFGNGESFLWKMKYPRGEGTTKNLQQGNSSNRQPIIMDIIQKESEIDVYPYTGDNGIDNDIIQICNHDKIAVGGATIDNIQTNNDGHGRHHKEGNVNSKNTYINSNSNSMESNNNHSERISCQQDQQQFKKQQRPMYGYGYGLHIQKDMLHGTTSYCSTFSSPSLSRKHADGSLFEIRNLELWSITPCMSEKDAEQMDRIGLIFMK